MMGHHQPSSSNRSSYTNHLQPNLIARLMGIDAATAIVPTPPPTSATVIQAQQTTTTSPPPSTPFNRAKCSLLSYAYPYCSSSSNGDSDSSSSSRLFLHNKMMRVPRSRSRRRHRHPQEDLLQKIRQDFQAWQASRAPGTAPVTVQVIAQEDLRKQKMARYGFGFPLGHNNSNSNSNSKLTPYEHSPVMKNNVMRQNEPSSSEHSLNSNKVVAAEPGLLPADRVTITTPVPCAAGASAEKLFRDLEVRENGGHDRNTSAQELELPSLSHTPIVLLKPSATTSEDIGAAICGQQKTFFFGLPKLNRDASMNMFLQEVKDRVQKELRLTAATTTTSDLKTTAAWGIQTKQIARDNTANKHHQIDQTVFTKDRGNKRLFRSESFRAFRRDRRRNGTPATTTPPTHASPEARILSSEAVSPEKDDEESMASTSITSRERAMSPLTYASPSVPGAGVQSFRSECLTKHKEEDVVPSPRVLFRSFSAPESGLSFSLGRLFVFGDGNGGVRCTKIEACEEGTDAAMTSKNANTSFSFSFIRGTVSRLRRHSFSLRRNLFRRKMTHWSKKMSLGVGKIHPKMEMPICSTSPSHETFNLFKVAQANLSELPPSPVSPLEVAGHSSRHFFTDLHCTLPELSPKRLSEAPASELSYRTDITLETVCSRDKAYIREVLIAAGLYDDGSLESNKANARVNSMARPICDDVFEDVEDMYYYRGEYIVGMYDETGGVTTDHRMLFDLANEALQSLVESSKYGSSLRQWVVDSTGVSRGKKLLDDVWQQVQTLRNPQMQEMQTIDRMVTYEVRRCVWAEVLFEDVYVVGRKIERAIFDELIEDLFAGGFHMVKPS